MPRQPTKNRIAMHDIISQPLTALPDAVNAILRRPEPLDDLEVQDIFHESSYILLRAEEALSVKDDLAFCALFKLFSEGFAHSESLFEEGIKYFVLHGSLLETLYSIFRVVVGQRHLPLHSQGTVELIQVIGSLCDSQALKESCGAVLMTDLAQLLAHVYEDKNEAKKHFHIQRAVATALINLVKGSKNNKLRLSSWKFVAECCTASVDVFFQLQCVELLFRVSRQKKGILRELEGSLRQDILDRLSVLPNDDRLLKKMIDLIEDLNSGNPEVLQFSLIRVGVAETMLSEKTEAYFTLYYFTVMITSSNADNVTIPYKSIRSVTLGKDGRIIIKLEDFPVKLEALLSHIPGMDAITLYLTLDRLREFKQSAIRGWILSELNTRKAALSQEPAKEAKEIISPTSLNHQPRSVSGSKRQTLNETLQKSHNDNQLDLPIHGSASSQPPELYRETLHKKTKLEPLECSEKLGSFVLEKPVLDAIENVSKNVSTEKARTFFAHLNRLIEAKMEVCRSEAMAALNKRMSLVQAKVDSARREWCEYRINWQQSISEKLQAIEQSINDSQNIAVDGVFKLNEYLRAIKQNNQTLNERIAFIEFDMHRTLEESREIELAKVQELHDMCKTDIEQQELELEQQIINRHNLGGPFLRHPSAPSTSDGA